MAPYPYPIQPGSYNIYAWGEGVSSGLSLNVDIKVPGPGTPPDAPVYGSKNANPQHWVVLPTCPPSNKFTIILASNGVWKLAVKNGKLWATVKGATGTEFSSDPQGSGNYIVHVGDDEKVVLRLDKEGAQVRTASPDSSKNELFSFY